jgi:hypothetical protein
MARLTKHEEGQYVETFYGIHMETLRGRERLSHARRDNDYDEVRREDGDAPSPQGSPRQT